LPVLKKNKKKEEKRGGEGRREEEISLSWNKEKFLYK
jgi:hypothetical protein